MSMAAPSPSGIRSGRRARASSTRSSSRCVGGRPARALQPSASAAAWESPCASNRCRRSAGGRGVPPAFQAGYHPSEEEIEMVRRALVTGGTRGIGAAICLALQSAGYQVVANYAGNEEAARKFSGETGIPVFRWSVADFDSCADGLARVEAETGPVDILVNNAGITRDTPFHKMTPEQWN